MRNSLNYLFNTLLAVLFLVPTFAIGQGGIGPLPFANPALLSPALGGLSQGNFGFNFSHRIRNATPETNFVTSVFNADYPYYSQKLNGGIGALVYLDEAGGLLRREAQVQLAWEAPLGRKIRYDHLRAGVSVGMIQLSVDDAQLVYADQFVPLTGTFSGASTDPVALAGTSTNAALDIGVGVLYYRTQKIVGNPEFNYYAGFGIHHVNRPKVSFLSSDGDDLRLSERYTVFGGLKYRLRSAIDMNVNFAYENQNSSQILQWGVFARTVFFEDGKLFGTESAAVFAGINGRLQLGDIPQGEGVVGTGETKRSGLQSITPFLGFEFSKTFKLAVASDIIVAKENSLLNSSYGGIQFMFGYILGGKKYNRPALPFPIF